MIRALWFALKVGLFVAAAVWIANRPGIIEFKWNEYDVQAHVGVTLLFLCFVLLAAILLYHILLSLFSLPSRMRNYMAAKRRAKGHRALTLGLTAVAAGDAKEAQLHTRRARRYLPEDKGLSHLLEGQVARLKGDDDGARQAFHRLLENKDTAFLGLRGLLVLAMESENREEARRLTRDALTLHPRQPWLLRMAYDLDIRESRWDAAQKLLSRMEKLEAMDAAHVQSDRAVLFLQQAEDADYRGQDGQALKFLQSAHKINPALIPASHRLAQYYLEHKNRSKAVSVLERSWVLQPHPDLVPLWREASPRGAEKDAVVRMKWFEHLVSLRPDSSEGQMAAGTEAFEQGSYAVADQYFDRAMELRPSARLYRLRARMAQARNRPEEATLMLKKASEAPQDKVWFCKETGRAYDHWAAIALPHGAFNTMVWGLPSHQIHDKAVDDRTELLFSLPARISSK